MAGEVLKQAIEKAMSLPPERQDELGKLILLEIEDDEQWDRQFAASKDILERLADAALEEDRLGRTKAAGGCPVHASQQWHACSS